MNNSSQPGLFITLEGPEGSGKSTQAPRLRALLEQHGWDVLLTREPGGTRIGEAIRSLLHDPAHTEMEATTEILLYCAARAQLVHQVLMPHLRKGGAVVCDRFADSTFAYQGYGRGLDRAMLRRVSGMAAGGLEPTYTVLLDLPIEAGLARRKQGGEWNRMDAMELAFHRRVREGYRELASLEPARWIVVDASGNADQVWQAMETSLLPILLSRGQHH